MVRGSVSHVTLGPGATTRRRYLSGAVRAGGGIAAAAAVAGCGPLDRLTGTPAPQLSGPVTVSYISNLAETHPEGAARLALLQEFTTTNALGISVRHEAGDVNLEKLKTVSAAGTPPDLAYFNYFSTVDLHVSGATIDVQPELAKEKDWAKQRADIFPAMLDSCLWLGKLVGIPGYTNNSGIIYNKGLLQQLGVPLPKSGWTWNDFRDAAQKAQRPQVQWAFSFPWIRWLRFLGTTDTHHISKDLRKMTIDTPESVETLEFLVGLVKAGAMPPDGANELYRRGNDIMFESQGPFRIPTLRQVNAPDFGVVHTPLHPRKPTMFNEVGGHNMGVFRETTPERRHAAALVAKWMNAPHAQAQMCIRAAQIPVNKSVMTDPELQAFLKTDEQLKGFVDLAPHNWGWPGIPSASALLEITRRTDPVFKEEVGIRAWLTDTQRQAQVLLDKDVALMK